MSAVKSTNVKSTATPMPRQGSGGERRGELGKEQEEEMRGGPERHEQPRRMDPQGRLARRHSQRGQHLLVQRRHSGESGNVLKTFSLP